MDTRQVATIIALAGALMSAEPAAAHAFVQRYDLPLPLTHYLAGAGGAVALTFVLIAVMRRSAGATLLSAPRDLSRSPAGRLLDAPALQRSAAVLSAAVFVFVLAAGLLGAQEDPLANILPTTVWIGWWAGLAFICALIGNVWPLINPWTIGARWLPKRPPRPYPVRLGAWPAVAVFLVFAWAELVWPDNAVPWKLATAVLLYSALTWAGMAAFGTGPWLRHGEAFSILFALFGRFAPLGRGEDGRLVLRPYGAGLAAGGPVSRSLAVFIVVALSTVTFDGFLHTPLWRTWFGAAFEAAYGAGLMGLMGNTGARTVIMTFGLLATPLVFLCLLAAASASIAALGSANGQRRSTAEVACHFIVTLVPIAVAYHLSHYLSLLLIEGQRFWSLLSDPFGFGWNLFGAAGRQPDMAAADARFLWGFSVVAIVGGHVVAVWLGHGIACRLFAGRGRALRSQIPMLFLMVGYTMLSLWILAQPIVES